MRLWYGSIAIKVAGTENFFPLFRFSGHISMEAMSEHDNLLIAEYDARRADDAFAALVRQHLNLVFATALRQVGDAGAAEEITQNVFVALARASGKLKSHPTIAGWLYQTTLNKSREWLRSELRRRRREQVAVHRQLAEAEGDSVWSPLVPLLDEALLKLREPDRLAVIMHFMEGQTFEEVGTALGVGEDTARKRVNRCLHELTHFFQRRGFAVPTLTATTPLFAIASHTVPTGLAASATTSSLAAAHSTASTSSLTLIKGALKIMAWTKTQTTIVIGVAVILAVSSATVIGIRVTHAYHSKVKAPPGLSAFAMEGVADLQPDGAGSFEFTVEATNSTGEIIRTDDDNDPEEIFTRITDQSGEPMKFVKQRGHYLITLNHPVPPGGAVSYTIEGKVSASVLEAENVIKSVGPNEYEFYLYGGPSSDRNLRYSIVWRLPPGATLLHKDHGLVAGTNGNQVEIHVEKIIPPRGHVDYGFRYRLASAQ